MHHLTEAEKKQIEAAKTVTNADNPQLQSFVRKFEANPNAHNQPNSRIRYWSSKLNFTFGQLEHALGLQGGSITASIYHQSPRVDAHLAEFFDVRPEDLRPPSTTTIRKKNLSPTKYRSLDVQSRLKCIVKDLGIIAAELDKI